LIAGVDFVAVPSTDVDRSRSFYVDTLGLRPDDQATYGFCAAATRRATTHE
jgi:catechol 2,3-dioxygenase-like lactoylglutathione lyase family enzyme